jgi:hypothetical protein
VASFDAVARPFLQQDGLPFAQVLGADTIGRAFAEEGALFAQDEIFSTPVVLWAFLAQALKDGKGAACAAAVADIVTYQQQIGAAVPSGDTGDYCRARAKLSPAALRRLVIRSARGLEEQAPDAWLWHGRHAKLVDGFTFTMPDTPANQEAFPQPTSQAPGVGFPMARACVVLSLATAAIHDLAFGPYKGKETGETALLREMLDAFDDGDIAVCDRYFCSFMMLALLQARGVDVCTRLHQRRSPDLRRGRRLGLADRLVTWTRPPRPEWMSEADYARIPETLTLRKLRFRVTEPNRRTEIITIVTTLIDPVAYPAKEIAKLYGFRWNVELDICVIKQPLGLDHLRCKTPAMIRREIWVALLAHNLIRKLIATAAVVHKKQPRQLGFTLACQSVLSSWMLLATGACRDPKAQWETTLAHIAANEVANRPGRIEPRVLKRRKHKYPLMTKPRNVLKKELAKT